MMIWLMGMKISFTKKPTSPMSRKPTLVALAIFMNSGAQKKNEPDVARTGRMQRPEERV